MHACSFRTHGMHTVYDMRAVQLTKTCVSSIRSRVLGSAVDEGPVCTRGAVVAGISLRRRT